LATRCTWQALAGRRRVRGNSEVINGAPASRGAWVMGSFASAMGAGNSLHAVSAKT
jgi:hypothetical protein